MNQPPKNSTIINVCVIPQVLIGSNCVNISQSLKSADTMFVLDGKEKFAHMTVYMARFANNQIPAVMAAAENVAKRARHFLCEHTGYFMTEGRYLEVSYRKSREFLGLHRAMIDNLREYRLNPGLPFEEGYFAPYIHQQQMSAGATGYDLAEDLYRPHITLTRYKEGLVPDIFPGFPPAELSFVMDQICVYKADDNGAVYERLAQFIVE